MYEYKAKLIRVVDGDTIDAEIDLGFKVYIKERIRFAGIDTPESRTRHKHEKSWGLAAKCRVKDLLEYEDAEFTLTTELQKKGKFGRILGTVILADGTSLSEILLDEKLAIPYEGGNKDESRIKYGVKELWEMNFYNTGPGWLEKQSEE
jgi:micrococcal nuclease